MTRLHDALIGAAVVLTVEAFRPSTPEAVLAALTATAALGMTAAGEWRRARARQRVGWRR